MSIGRLAHYEIQERIGQGGMGVVFKALDTRLERTVAIKVMPALVNRDAERRARFLREARAVARLNHPNVANIYEIAEGKLEGADIEPLGAEGALNGLYIAMEFVPGEDLEQRLQRGELDQDEALRLALQIAEGLEAAHDAGVVHRDLKPHNIRITPEGRVKILDFGLAKLREEQTVIQPALDVDIHHHTQAGMIVGTVPYMAPEQVEGKAVDLRADLFAFGVVLYQMFAGRLPFPGGDLIEFVKSLAKAEPERLSQVNPAAPREIESVVHRLIEANPEKRYQDTRTLVADLRAISIRPEGLVVSPGGSLFDPALPWLYERGKRRWLGLAAALGVIGIVLVAWWWLVGRDGPPPERVPRPTTVAVLPARNMTGDSAQDLPCIGVSEDLARRLMLVPSLVVTTQRELEQTKAQERSTVPTSRQAPIEIAVSCRSLGQASAFDVQAAVTNSETGVILGSDTFTNPEELAYQVIQVLDPNLGGEVSEQQRTFAVSDEAYSKYITGLGLSTRAEDPRDFKLVIANFEQALNLESEFPRAYAALSDANWQLFHLTDEAEAKQAAIDAADHAIDLAPNLPDSIIAKAHALRATGESEAAIEMLTALVKANQNNDAGWAALAQAQLRAQQFDETMTSLQRAIDLRPKYWRYHDRMGLLFQARKEYAQATSAYERAIGLADRDVVRPRLNMMSLFLETEQFDRFFEMSEDLDREVHDPVFANNTGVAYFSKERFAEATSWFRRAVEVRPGSASIWANLGDSLRAEGKAAEANEVYGTAAIELARQIEARPGDARLRSLRPVYLAKSGDCTRAIDDASDLVAQSTDSADSFRLAGQAFALCGQLDRSASSIEKAIALGISPSRLRMETELVPVLERLGVN